MPIGGFVVYTKPQKTKEVLRWLSSRPEVEVYGHDEAGHVIVVLETETSEQMEDLVQIISQRPGVLHCDLAYLHGEDEVKKIEAGEIKPPIRFHRLRPEESS